MESLLGLQQHCPAPPPGDLPAFLGPASMRGLHRSLPNQTPTYGAVLELALVKAGIGFGAERDIDLAGHVRQVRSGVPCREERVAVGRGF